MPRLMNAIAGAALMLDAEGRLLDANDSGEAFLADPDTPFERAAGTGVLRAADQDAQAALKQIVRFARNNDATGGFARVSNQAGDPICLVCNPLAELAFDPWRRATALITIAEPRGRYRDVAPVLRD